MNFVWLKPAELEVSSIFRSGYFQSEEEIYQRNTWIAGYVREEQLGPHAGFHYCTSPEFEVNTDPEEFPDLVPVGPRALEPIPEEKQKRRKKPYKGRNKKERLPVGTPLRHSQLFYLFSGFEN